jgi:hypothetical protein
MAAKMVSLEDYTDLFQKTGRDLELEASFDFAPKSVSAEVNCDSADDLSPTLHTFVHTLAGGNPSSPCNRHRVSSL